MIVRPSGISSVVLIYTLNSFNQAGVASFGVADDPGALLGNSSSSLESSSWSSVRNCEPDVWVFL